MSVFVHVMLSICTDMLAQSLLYTSRLLYALLCDNHFAYVWAVFPSAILFSITCRPLWLTVSALYVRSAHFLLTYSSSIIAAFTASALQDIDLLPFLIIFLFLSLLPFHLPCCLLPDVVLLLLFFHLPFLLLSFAPSSFLLPFLHSSLPPTFPFISPASHLPFLLSSLPPSSFPSSFHSSLPPFLHSSRLLLFRSCVDSVDEPPAAPLLTRFLRPQHIHRLLNYSNISQSACPSVRSYFRPSVRPYKYLKLYPVTCNQRYWGWHYSVLQQNDIY